MSDKGSGTLFVAGLAAGILAGAIIALILAPRSGAENRGIIRKKTSGIGDRIKEATANRQDVYTQTWKENKGKYKVRPTA